jgi:hypothetical protein
MIDIEHRPRGSGIVRKIADARNAASAILIDGTAARRIERCQRTERCECFRR